MTTNIDKGPKRIIVFRDRLGLLSENFVIRQAEALETFIPFYVGSTLVPPVSVPADRRFLINEGGPLGLLHEAQFKTVGRSRALMQWAKRIGFRLVHAHFGPDGVRALPIADALSVPLIVTFHGYDATVADRFAKSFGQKQYVRHRSLLGDRADLCIAVSEFVARRLEAHGFPAERIRVHKIGVDTTLFQAQARMPRAPIILFVGRLVAGKGCSYLLQALHALQPELADIEAVVIGDGPLRASLEDECQALRVRCRFLGSQLPHEVKSWMNRAKVFCMPSITDSTGWTEGFGLAALEAQAMGLPVVGFSTGGMPESVEHNASGLLVKEGDVSALGAALRLLLVDQPTWQRMSLRGRDRAASLDLRVQTRKLEEIYHAVLQGSGGVVV